MAAVARLTYRGTSGVLLWVLRGDWVESKEVRRAALPGSEVTELLDGTDIASLASAADDGGRL